MNRKDLLKDMKGSIGTKDPLVFFGKMVDVFELLFDRLESLENENYKVKLNTVMLMNWEPNVAAGMVSEELKFLRTTGKQTDGTNMYQQEIDELKNIHTAPHHLQNYVSFVKFWRDLLGYHPFLEARK